MKKVFVFILGVFFSTIMFSQEFSANVQRFSGIPVYVYSTPIESYDIVETISVPMFASSPAKEKINAVITKVNQKKKKGKISDFNAILMDIENNQGTVILVKPTE